MFRIARPVAIPAILLAVLSLAACSGGAGSGVSPAGPTSVATATPVPTAMPSNAPVGSGTAAVTFRINWPPTSAAAPTGRRPKYLPATARSASIATNGGVPQYINSPTATLTFTAPVGLDTFVVQVYDEQNGKGDILSSADITQKISGSSANIVSTTLNGVIASLSLVLSTYTTAAGSVRNVAVAANGLDAEGNTIVGPGDYDRPIALAIVDPANTGTLSLSKKILATPGSVVTLAYNGGSLFSAQIVATANGVPSVSATFAPTPTFSRFAITQAGASPVYITQGSDGNMWFTDTGTNAIGKITPAGAIAEYTIPTPASGPRGITTVAADGSLWFTESTASQIGTLLTNGTNFREFPTATAGDRPQLLADRGDGNVWYAGEQGNDVSYQPTSGGASNVATSASQSGSEPFGVAAGTDANMYFTEDVAGNIGRTGIPNTLQEVALPSGSASLPTQIVRGPDGNFWFTEAGVSKIGVLSPVSFTVINEYATLSPDSFPVALTVGKDGALWFTQNNTNRIGRITTAGALMDFQLPGNVNNALGGIATAPDGSLWFCEQDGHIGRLQY